MAKRCRFGVSKTSGKCLKRARKHSSRGRRKRCQGWAMVMKPSLGRPVRTCVNWGKGKGRAEGEAIHGPLRPSGLLGLGEFLGFL